MHENTYYAVMLMWDDEGTGNSAHAEGRELGIYKDVNRATEVYKFLVTHMDMTDFSDVSLMYQDENGNRTTLHSYDTFLGVETHGCSEAGTTQK